MKNQELRDNIRKASSDLAAMQRYLKELENEEEQHPNPYELENRVNALQAMVHNNYNELLVRIEAAEDKLSCKLVDVPPPISCRPSWIEGFEEWQKSCFQTRQMGETPEAAGLLSLAEKQAFEAGFNFWNKTRLIP